MTQTASKQNFRSLFTELFRFALPLVAASILQQLYNWVDAFIVGNVEGEIALGAIGGTGTLTNLFLRSMTGFCIGLAVIAGQKYGEQKYAFIDALLSRFAILLTAIYTVVCLGGILASVPLLHMMHTPSDTFLQANTYLRIILVGIPFLTVYNVYAAILRGRGDSKAPFFSILVSSAMNIVLDILFVAVLHQGIRGAALATIMAQISMTFFIVFYTIRRHPEIHFIPPWTKIDAEVTAQGFRFGIPQLIQEVVSSFGKIVLQTFMNGFGTATVIAITTAYRIDSVTMLPITNMAAAISTLSAQSYGARNKTRILQVRKAGLLIMTGISLLLTLVVITFGSQLIALFGAGEEAVRIGHGFFVRLASFYVIFGLGSAIRGYLQGLGDVVSTSFIGIAMLGVRIALSFLLKPVFGNMVIAYAEGLSWVFGLVIYLIRMKAKRNQISFES